MTTGQVANNHAILVVTRLIQRTRCINHPIALFSTIAMQSIASLKRTITVHCTVNDKRTHGLTPMPSLLSPEEDNAERCVTSAHNMCVTNALGMHCVTRITLCSRDTTQRCHTLVTLVTSAHSIPVHSMMNALQTTNRTSGFITTSS